jgi:hypothetical protein
VGELRRQLDAAAWEAAAAEQRTEAAEEREREALARLQGVEAAARQTRAELEASQRAMNEVGGGSR